MRRILSAGALALAGLLLVTLAPSLARAQTPQTVNLTVTEFMITPMNFTATAGQPVHFTVTNTGKFPHSITFAKGTKFVTLFKTPIPSGASGTDDFIFPEAGTWQMYCPVGQHAEAGMTGSVQVLTAGTPGMPTTGMPTEVWMPLLALFALALTGAGLLLRQRLLPR
jgi:uncharacterized cupredoxin-like copper-binding protein